MEVASYMGHTDVVVWLIKKLGTRGPVVPPSSFFVFLLGSRFPYKVANPKKGTLIKLGSPVVPPSSLFFFFGSWFP